jgi:hypothetical protein
MKQGYHRRNGVPASSKAVTTHWFIRHGTELTIVQFTEDPVYLDEIHVRTTDFQLNPTQNVGPLGLGFEAVDEIATWEPGYVPQRQWRHCRTAAALPSAGTLPPREVCVSEEEEYGSDQLKRYGIGGSRTYPESRTGHRSPVRVVVPEEPPEFSPAAARALLRIIRKAHAQRFAEGRVPRSAREGPEP